MTDKNTQPQNQEEPSTEEKQIVDKTNIGYVFSAIDINFDEKKTIKAISEHLDALAAKHDVSNYTIIYLLDAEDSLSSWHTNRIYKVASEAKKEKDILLVVHSLGGSIEAGYFIGKTGKRLAHSKFVVAVPRKAKSAATLLSLGADEIHMGLLSELGPIDPQIGGFPAQGLKNAIEILLDMSCRHNGSGAMLAEFLNRKLDLRTLGLFERINESAIQYAERLIADKKLAENQTAKSLAGHLVNHYKDHSFVIDHDEAAQLLGKDIVHSDTKEYSFANEVFESFDLIRFFLGAVANKDADLVGSSSSGVRIFDKRQDP